MATFRISADDCEEWSIAPFNQKTFGRSFNPSDWKDKLSKVHDWLWAKWYLAKDREGFQLENPSDEQSPGVIPDDIAQELQGFIDRLESRVKYPRVAP